jgi:hypothetical protein
MNNFSSISDKRPSSASSSRFSSTKNFATTDIRTASPVSSKGTSNLSNMVASGAGKPCSSFFSDDTNDSDIHFSSSISNFRPQETSHSSSNSRGSTSIDSSSSTLLKRYPDPVSVAVRTNHSQVQQSPKHVLHSSIAQLNGNPRSNSSEIAPFHPHYPVAAVSSVRPSSGSKQITEASTCPLNTDVEIAALRSKNTDIVPTDTAQHINDKFELFKMDSDRALETSLANISEIVKKLIGTKNELANLSTQMDGEDSLLKKRKHAAVEFVRSLRYYFFTIFITHICLSVNHLALFRNSLLSSSFNCHSPSRNDVCHASGLENEEEQST